MFFNNSYPCIFINVLQQYYMLTSSISKFIVKRFKVKWITVEGVL